MQEEYVRLSDTLYTPVLAVRAAAVCAFVRCAGCGAKRCNRDTSRCNSDTSRCNRDTRCGAWEDILKSQLAVPGVACCAATGTHCAATETHRAATGTHRAAAEINVAEPRVTFSKVAAGFTV